ncbi:MAG: type II secretion system F family protein [Pseudomonadales bacterium]|jgi:type IV pilus assembly protein PilC|nr:type II secretion system F family protein [Pseudomonadales bacterium]
MAESAVYVYEGTDRAGKRTKGTITGVNAQQVKVELRKQGINAQRVSKKSESILARIGAAGGKVTSADVTLFTRQMATMMKAGVPLVQSFDIVADGLDNPKLKDLVKAVRADVSAGNSFASAIRKHPEHFDELFCNLVDSGEQSGALETMLDRVATYKEKTESLKAKIKKAMTYPIAVIVIAFVVSGILLIKVVPQFEEIFAGFGAELPAFTQFVIGISEFAQAWWFLIVLGIAVLAFAISQIYKRSEAARHAVDRLLLKLPVVGDIINKSAVARFARTLSTTFAAGVPLVDALKSVAGATGNVVYSDAVARIADDVATGTQLTFAMRSTGVWPNMVLQMTSIGEESGALDAMLDKAASYFEEQVDNAVDSLTDLMEPMIMSILGVLVGGLIIAMYLPIFQLGSVVGG